VEEKGGREIFFEGESDRRERKRRRERRRRRTILHQNPHKSNPPRNRIIKREKLLFRKRVNINCMATTRFLFCFLVRERAGGERRRERGRERGTRARTEGE